MITLSSLNYCIGHLSHAQKGASLYALVYVAEGEPW